MLQTRRDVQQHVTILGWLYIIGHALSLVVGAFIFLLLTGIGARGVAEEAGPVLVVVDTTVGLLLAALSLPGLAAGYGLLISILSLANVPLGTITGLYALWVLSPPGRAPLARRRRRPERGGARPAAGRALRAGGHSVAAIGTL